jgi:serine phosphatase RsbU (regulator of sigma subunit)
MIVIMKSIPLTIIFNLLIIACYGQSLNKLDSLKIRLSEEKSDTGKVILYYRIAYELQFAEPEQAQEYAQKAFETAEKIKYTKGIGNSLIQLGNLEQIKGNNIKAEEFNLKALDILTKINDLPGIAICYNNLGILTQNANNNSKAIEYYSKALNINSKIGRKSGEASSLFCIGTVYENQAKYDSALFYYQKAQSISESIADIRLMAIGKTSLANVYFMMENYRKSLEYYEEAIILFEKSGNNWGLLKVYTSLGQTAERLDTASLAIWFYHQALKISNEIQSPNDQAGSYFSIARLFENNGNFDSARYNYEKSYSLFTITDNKENSALSLIALARLENYRHNYYGAKTLLNEALKTAREIQSPSALTEAYREMAMTFSGLKDFRSAFSSLNRYSEIKDSLMTVEKQGQIIEMQTQFETEKKEKENEILRKDQKILQTSRNSLVIGAFLLLTIAVLISRSLSIKKRDNRLLRQQKEEIKRQKEIVEVQKTSITDSIRYAKRIQSAMLPPEELLKQTLPESFVLYLPRDIVSGDFYLLRNLNENRMLVCVADCTGHGVPGAFMSMLGMSLINDIINSYEDQIITDNYTPADILNELRERIKRSLRQTGKEGEARDGMDLSLCIIEKDTRKLRYSGANNSVYIVNNETLTELKATRNPIGIYLNEISFTTQTVEITPGSLLYMFSDGYSDQIGSGGRKFLSKNFKILLTGISHLPMEEIKETLNKTHLGWRKDEEQVDDILVAGFRIPVQ